MFSLSFLSFPSPLGFFAYSIWFSTGWNSACFVITSQTPPSLWLLVFLLPPSCVESSAVNDNPGLSCPAVCIPSLLGEHGMAPGPLCSHRREVNDRERERANKREREKGGKDRDTVGLFDDCHSCLCWRLLSFCHSHRQVRKREEKERWYVAAVNEETSVTSWFPSQHNISSDQCCIFVAAYI